MPDKLAKWTLHAVNDRQLLLTFARFRYHSLFTLKAALHIGFSLVIIRNYSVTA